MMVDAVVLAEVKKQGKVSSNRTRQFDFVAKHDLVKGDIVSILNDGTAINSSDITKIRTDDIHSYPPSYKYIYDDGVEGEFYYMMGDDNYVSTNGATRYNTLFVVNTRTGKKYPGQTLRANASGYYTESLGYTMAKMIEMPDLGTSAVRKFMVIYSMWPNPGAVETYYGELDYTVATDTFSYTTGKQFATSSVAGAPATTTANSYGLPSVKYIGSGVFLRSDNGSLTAHKYDRTATAGSTAWSVGTAVGVGYTQQQYKARGEYGLDNIQDYKLDANNNMRYFIGNRDSSSFSTVSGRIGDYIDVDRTTLVITATPLYYAGAAYSSSNCFYVGEINGNSRFVLATTHIDFRVLDDIAGTLTLVSQTTITPTTYDLTYVNYTKIKGSNIVRLTGNTGTSGQVSNIGLDWMTGKWSYLKSPSIRETNNAHWPASAYATVDGGEVVAAKSGAYYYVSDYSITIIPPEVTQDTVQSFGTVAKNASAGNIVTVNSLTSVVDGFSGLNVGEYVSDNFLAISSTSAGSRISATSTSQKSAIKSIQRGYWNVGNGTYTTTDIDNIYYPVTQNILPINSSKSSLKLVVQSGSTFSMDKHVLRDNYIKISKSGSALNLTWEIIEYV